MIYFVYKNDIEKKYVEDLMIKDNMFIYKTSLLKDRIDYLTSFISYSSIIDQALLKNINKNEQCKYDDGENIYYRLYGIESKESLEDLQKFIFDLVVFYTSGDDQSVYFHIFYDKIYNDLYNKMNDYPNDNDILSDIKDLGLIAFSTKPDTLDGNILIESAFDDRNLVRDFYDYYLGEGSFKNINEYAKMISLDYALNNQNVSSNEFNKLIDGLKEYFYKYISISDELTEDQKNEMYKKFDEAYNGLKEKHKLHQSK